MWVYRYGEISYSSAVSEGTIHAIQGLYVNWREPILWLPTLSVLSGILGAVIAKRVRPVVHQYLFDSKSNVRLKTEELAK